MRASESGCCSEEALSARVGLPGRNIVVFDSRRVIKIQVASLVLLTCETDFVSKNEEFVALANDIAMHVSAMSPKYIAKEELDDAMIEKAKEVFAEEVNGKPEEMREKIMEGKLASYFKDQILLEQPFVKNPETTIGEMVTGAVQKFGEKVMVSQISRISVK